MNWNSSAFSETLPITLRFACDVGDILRELPERRKRQPEYRYDITPTSASEKHMSYDGISLSG